MKALLKIEPGTFNNLIAHLLPPGNEQEQAAFLFAHVCTSEESTTFTTTETRKLYAKDFVMQHGDHIELTEDTCGALIKRAHDLSACLVEIHSHLGLWPAEFSIADRMGLRETVPHMWWRLRKRPYLALVVTETSFDALVWLDNAKVPRTLDGLIAGEQLMTPTNNSLGGW